MKIVGFKFECIDNQVVFHQKVIFESFIIKFSGKNDKKYDKAPTSPYMIVESVGDKDPSLE